MVHHNAETENVRAVIISLLFDNFWTEVQGSTNLLRFKVSFFIDECALTQVAKLECAVFCYQNVHGLNISVDDIMRVAMEKCKTNLPCNEPQLLLGEVLSLDLLLVDQLLHVSLLSILHSDIKTHSMRPLTFRLRYLLLVWRWTRIYKR